LQHRITDLKLLPDYGYWETGPENPQAFAGQNVAICIVARQVKKTRMYQLVKHSICDTVKRRMFLAFITGLT
jgi:hypothetical protein